MPAERTVDQRLSALERRLDAPEHVQTTDQRSRSRDRSGDSGTPGVGPPTGTEDLVEDPSPTAGTRPDCQSDGGGSHSSDTGPSDIEARLDSVEAELAELQAGLQALRGYVGNVDHVNETVERRANAALAAVERLEAAPTSPPSLASADGPGNRAGPEDAATDDGGSPSHGVPEDATEEPVDTEPGEGEEAATGRGLLDRLVALG